MYAGCLFISSPKNSAVVVVHAGPKLQLRNQVCVAVGDEISLGKI